VCFRYDHDFITQRKRGENQKIKPLLERFCTHGMYNRPAHDYANTKIRSNPFLLSLRSSSSLTENILNSFEVTLWSDADYLQRRGGRRTGVVARGGAGYYTGCNGGIGVRTSRWAGGCEGDGTTLSERALVATRGTEFGLPVADRARCTRNASLTPTPSPAPHHHRYPMHSQQHGTTTTTTPGRARGWAAAARARRTFTHTRTNIHLHVVHTRNTHARARTHGVGDALATMRNRSASVRIKVTTPPYSALYTGCFHRVTNRSTRTQSSILLPKIIG